MIEKNIYGFPINYVRAQFPALKRIYNDKPVIYLDGPGGSQVVSTSIEAIKYYMSKGGANLHGQFQSSKETSNLVMETKETLANMFGTKANEVVFGANVTTLEFLISKAIAQILEPGDEIVVSELEHRANVKPWTDIAEEKGITIRWLKVNINNLTLDLSELYSVITEKTRLVAIGLASNAIGTINEVEIISARAKSVGAIVVVDAAHAVPHFYIDLNRISADILLCSAYKFFGPHIGIAFIKESISEKLKLNKLDTAPDYISNKLELGTQNYECIAGIRPTIEFIASLGSGGTIRDRIISGYKEIESHENRLASRIRNKLWKLDGVKLYQAPDWARKTPTIAFRIEGISPKEVCKVMAEEYSIFIEDGNFYATSLANKLDINKTGGWIRLGISPYNNEEETESFIKGIKNIVNNLKNK